MDLDQNKQFFIDLFSNSKFPGHGVRVDAPGKLDVNVLVHGTVDERVKMYKDAFDFDLECAELRNLISIPDIWAKYSKSPIVLLMSAEVDTP